MHVIRGLAICVLAALGLDTLPAKAQVTEFGDFQQADTRFGTLTLPVSNQFGRTEVYLNGAPTGIDSRWISILGAYAYPGEQADWVLLRTTHGGNMCPESYIILRLSANGATRTEQFADCLGRLRQLRVLPGRIELDVDDPDLTVAYKTFAWDGASAFSVSDVAVSLGQGTAPITGVDMARWIGRNSTEPLSDPAVQARFLTIMTPQFVEDLRRVMGVPGRIEQRGNWILGSGCQAHACNATAGVWGIRLTDNAAAAVFLMRTAPDEWRGSGAALADPVFRGFVEEKRWK